MPNIKSLTRPREYTIERLQELRSQADKVGDTASRDTIAAMIVERGGVVLSDEIPEDETKLSRLERLRRKALSVNDTESAEKLAELIAEEEPEPIAPYKIARLRNALEMALEEAVEEGDATKVAYLTEKLAEAQETGGIDPGKPANWEQRSAIHDPNTLPEPEFQRCHDAADELTREWKAICGKEPTYEDGDIPLSIPPPPETPAKTVTEDAPTTAVGEMPFDSDQESDTTTADPKERVSSPEPPPKPQTKMERFESIELKAKISVLKDRLREAPDDGEFISEDERAFAFDDGPIPEYPNRLYPEFNDDQLAKLAAMTAEQSGKEPPPEPQDAPSETISPHESHTLLNNGTASISAKVQIERNNWNLAEIPAKDGGKVTIHDVRRYKAMLSKE